MDARGQLVRRASSMRFREHQDLAEEMTFQRLKKQASDSVCNHASTCLLLLICMWLSSEPNCGDNTKGLLKLAILVKLAICAPMTILIYMLVRVKTIKANSGSLLNGLLWLCMLGKLQVAFKLY